MEHSTILTKFHSHVFSMHEKHKPEGLLSYCRDFVFLRKAVHKESIIYLIDSSIPDAEPPAAGGCVRGAIERRVYAVLRHPNTLQSLVIQLLQVRQGGYYSEAAGIKRTRDLLREMANLASSY